MLDIKKLGNSFIAITNKLLKLSIYVLREKPTGDYKFIDVLIFRENFCLVLEVWFFTFKVISVCLI